MMTSGTGVHYKSMIDAGAQVREVFLSWLNIHDLSPQMLAKEGWQTFFKGAGANILRGVAAAVTLSLYDKFQAVMFGKVYSGGQ